MKLNDMKTILIVDDDTFTTEILMELLEDMGYLVSHAENGSAALKIFQSVDNIDLIITDIMMPNGDGINLITEIKKKQPDIPVIAVSGVFSEEFITRVDQSGADVFFKKPVAIVDLEKAVNSFLS